MTREQQHLVNLAGQGLGIAATREGCSLDRILPSEHPSRVTVRVESTQPNRLESRIEMLETEKMLDTMGQDSARALLAGFITSIGLDWESAGVEVHPEDIEDVQTIEDWRRAEGIRNSRRSERRI